MKNKNKRLQELFLLYG